jgi:hypothetical protein
MIQLTGKSGVDFTDWLYKEYRITYWDSFKGFEEFIKMAYIKKFFEAKYIQFGIDPMQGGEIRGFILDNKFTHHWIDDRFETEEELLKALIPLANSIYNQRKTK